MAKSAMKELTTHIETIRQEAYNEGYAAAMRAVVQFSASGNAKPKATAAKGTSAKPAVPKAVPRQTRAKAKPAARQTRRGDNARHIAEAMMTLPDHSGPAAAIKKALTAKGHELAYTSIRHGLGQLQARGEASVTEDGRTWRYVPQH